MKRPRYHFGDSPDYPVHGFRISGPVEPVVFDLIEELKTLEHRIASIAQPTELKSEAYERITERPWVGPRNDGSTAKILQFPRSTT